MHNSKASQGAEVT